MHDQAASRISGRTRAAVSAMCVRAVRITVLKSAGNFTRNESHDLNAEKIQPVKCFMFTRCGICCVPAIFERRRGRLGSKISTYGQLAEVAVYFATSGLPPAKQTPIEGSACPLGATSGLLHRNKTRTQPITLLVRASTIGSVEPCYSIRIARRFVNDITYPTGDRM